MDHDAEDPRHPSLAAALASADRAAVGRALRERPVVVPHIERDDGTPQVRVFDAFDGAAKPYVAGLFSSPEALSDHLGDDPGRGYSLRSKESIAPFLRRHGAVLEHVVVDPASEHAMLFGVEELLEALDTPAPSDDPTGLFDQTGAGIGIDAIHAVATVGEPDGSRGFGLELNLPDHWTIIEVADPQARDRQIRDLVKAQTRTLGDTAAPLRRDLRERMLAAAVQAESGGAQVMAYLTLTQPGAALALNLTMYWHDVAAARQAGTHLRETQRRLERAQVEGDVVTWTDTLSGPFLRQIRRRAGSPEVGGQDVPLLLVDYWCEAPGAAALAHLAFSTPHVDIAEQIVKLTDKVLFATEWLLTPPGVASGAEQAELN